MKTMRLAMMMIALAAISAETSAAMSLVDIRREARFLTDRMGYELGLTDRQYNDVYEINFDFFYHVNEVIDDMVYGYDDAIDYYYYLLDVRNEDLLYVLRSNQYRRFVKCDYFYRPIYLSGSRWSMRIYTRYTDRDYYYYSKPIYYDTYCGAHYRIHFKSSYYAALYTHRLFDGAFRLWGGGYNHCKHDGWMRKGHRKPAGSRNWGNAKNYENSRRNLKAGLVNVPSRDESKRVVSVNSVENKRTVVTSSSRRQVSGATTYRADGAKQKEGTAVNHTGRSNSVSTRAESAGSARRSSSSAIKSDASRSSSTKRSSVTRRSESKSNSSTVSGSSRSKATDNRSSQSVSGSRASSSRGSSAKATSSRSSSSKSVNSANSRSGSSVRGGAR